MSERKHPVEVTEDGRFILEPFVYNDLTLQNIGNQKELEKLKEELEQVRGGIKHYQEENERLHTLLLNLTSGGRINNNIN
ncbi:hypothetical protein [Vagococcus fluvialis]|uniref:hypothetical protein n=1 Tax=Vagococcus fluvialis TaxID=2738 RepID=UPI003B21419D